LGEEDKIDWKGAIFLGLNGRGEAERSDSTTKRGQKARGKKRTPYRGRKKGVT